MESINFVSIWRIGCRVYVMFFERFVEMHDGIDEFQCHKSTVLEDLHFVNIILFGIGIDVSYFAFLAISLWDQSPLWFRGHRVAGTSFRIVACANQSG